MGLGSQRCLHPTQIHGGGSGGGFGRCMRPCGIGSGYTVEVGPKQTHGSSRVEFRLVRYPVASVVFALTRPGEGVGGSEMAPKTGDISFASGAVEK
eukprot:g33311.t1